MGDGDGGADGPDPGTGGGGTLAGDRAAARLSPGPRPGRGWGAGGEPLSPTPLLPAVEVLGVRVDPGRQGAQRLLVGRRERGEQREFDLVQGRVRLGQGGRAGLGDRHVVAAAVGRVPAADGQALALQVVEDADQHARIHLQPLGEHPLADGATLRMHQRHRVRRGEPGRAERLLPEGLGDRAVPGQEQAQPLRGGAGRACG
ncbi:hypothetical protein ACS04_33525 [Streptomyces roseus]|uniref:Uncharacterized protein n=1 Tax=Streptomyces roseus TaxID=66430 RepID=A0A0J7A8L9_9ACTN|nr:hypothetical protein ACS04_33525 [Streptomyces roseus]